VAKDNNQIASSNQKEQTTLNQAVYTQRNLGKKDVNEENSESSHFRRKDHSD
jgi:hypothetical protein